MVRVPQTTTFPPHLTMNIASLLALTLLVTVPATSRYSADPALETSPWESVEPTSSAALLGVNPPLEITCPDEFKDMCDAAMINPSVTGNPMATGGCGGYTFAYTDTFTRHPAADRFQLDVLRTWTVTDSCGGTASCTQVIHLMRQRWDLDIKPTSCPNPVNLGVG